MLGKKYKNRSVAEQNSFDISFELLLKNEFKQLRSALCPTPKDSARFRQLVINSVMATDLGDKGLKELRSKRWEIAFSETSGADDSGSISISTSITNSGSTDPFGSIRDARSSITATSSSSKDKAKNVKRTVINRKATVVIESLIQAADVAHMSQVSTVVWFMSAD